MKVKIVALLLVVSALAAFAGTAGAGEGKWLAVGILPPLMDAGKLAPGTEKDLAFDVVNAGNIPATAVVSVDGSRWSGIEWPEGAAPAPAEWAKCEPGQVNVEKTGEVEPVTVKLSVPKDAPGGKYAFIVAARTHPDGGNILVSTSSLALVTFTVEGSLPFSDISGHWAQNDIAYLASRGIARGYPDGTFRPDEEVTRLESVLFVARALNLNRGPEGSLAKFADADKVPGWARAAAAAAAGSGLVAGDLAPDGLLYAPGRKVTRTEAALFVLRALSPEKRPGKTGDLTFTDAEEIPVWAKSDLVQAVAADVAKGYPDRTFRPNAGVTRAEMAAMLVRALKM